MRRDYFIIHSSKDNERAIMRTEEEDVQYLNKNSEWTKEKKRAKRFYHKDSAEGALVLCKIKGLKEEQLQRFEVEKQSWS